MKKYDKNNDEYLIDILFMISKELRIFNTSYLYLFFFIFAIGLFISYFIDNYSGLLPFSQSMISTTSNIRLMNDVVIIYAIISFGIMFAKWLFVGFSQMSSIRFRKYEKWFWENRAEYLTDNQLDNRRNVLFIVPICLIILIPCMWIYTFGLSYGGNSPKMQQTLKDPSFIIYFYMIFGYITSLFTVIFSITSMEFRKYVL